MGDVRRLACPGGIHPLGDGFIPHCPGPLEEREEQRELPAELAEGLRSQLQSADPLEPAHFTALVNCAANFRIGRPEAKFATTALTQAEYRLTNIESPTHLSRVLSDLSTVAATARDEELADALRVVVRRYRHQPEFAPSVADTLRIFLRAAASREELRAWASFVGDSLTELAFGDLTEGDALVLLYYVHRLCGMVPELWATCGKAEAALQGAHRSQTV